MALRGDPAGAVDHGPDLLPTIEDPKRGPEDATDATRLATGATGYVGVPNYRRHNRKRSSLIMVPPRTPAVASDQRTGDDPLSGSVSTLSFLSGAGILAGSQVLAKMLTFALNQALLRFVNPQDLGNSSRMDLLGTTILSLARDAVRSAAQREILSDKATTEYRSGGGVVHGTRDATMQETVNLGWVPLSLGLVMVALAETLVYLFSDPAYRVAAIIYGVSTVVELASEPSFLLIQLKLEFKKRAIIESLGMIARCLVTFSVLAAGRPAVFGYALGQLAYSVVLWICYFLDIVAQHHYASFKLYPKRVWHETDDTKMMLNPQSGQLAMGMYVQSAFKYLLTESDRLLISFLLPPAGQGEYALAANYGSLIARIFLFPIEETLRSIFAKSLVTSSLEMSAKADSTLPGSSLQKLPPPTLNLPTGSPQLDPGPFSAPPIDRIDYLTPGAVLSPYKKVVTTRARSVSVNSAYSISSEQNDTESPPFSPAAQRFTQADKTPDTELAVTILTNTLRVYSYLGLIVAIFGPLAARYLLSLLVPKSWLDTAAPQVLAGYMCYIPILAWNGALEALIQSVASVSDLKRQGRAMLVLSLAFVVESYILMWVFKLGAVGLIYAQALNMSLRILWSLSYVVDYFNLLDVERGWLLKALPGVKPLSAAVLAASIAFYRGSIRDLTGLMIDGGLGASLLAVIVVSERDLLLPLISKSGLYSVRK